MLKVFQNGVTEWVIAESPEDATKVLVENGFPPLDAEDEWEECSPDTTWTLVGEFTKSGQDEKRTFAEWILLQGRGYLGTTEY